MKNSRSDYYEFHESREELMRDSPKPKTCPYRNDDDGSDSAWCVQTFSGCDDERMENCEEAK